MWTKFDANLSGGFDKTISTEEDPDKKKKEQVKRVQNIVPVFISYITGSTSEDFTLHGNAVQMVDILGVVRKFDVQSTKMTCSIEDQTGSIKAVSWLESEGNSVTVLPPIQENCYVRVFGSVRNQEGSKMIMILKIVPIDDINVITYHRLQIIHAMLSMRGPKDASFIDGPSQGAPSEPMKDTLSYSEIDVAQTSSNGLSRTQAKIMSILKNASDYKGVSINVISSQVAPAKAAEINAALDFLLNEGYVYTTCDNDHYKATDGI